MDLGVLLFIGALSGLIAGLVGLAGGIVVVPALTWLYGVDALHGAIVISWFAVLFNSFSASARQWRVRTAQERHELLHGARWYLAGAVLISPAVAAGASRYQGLVTPTAVAVLQLCVTAVMFWPVADTARPRREAPARDVSAGGIVAALSTLIGVGGGPYTIAYLSYGAGIRFRDAIAAANLMGFAIGLMAVAGFLAHLPFAAGEAAARFGPITPLSMAAIIVSGMLAAPLGVRWSLLVPTRALRRILGMALALSALRLLFS